MKKKGVALVTVLIIFTALIIIGTSISTAVINTTKLNKRYSDTIDLELAAKSGINIVKEDFISKVNSNEIYSLDKVNEYITNITSQQSINSLIKEYLDNNITLTLNLDLKSDTSNEKNRLEITSVAENEGNSSVKKIEEQSLVLDIKEGSNSGSGVVPSLSFNKLFNIGKEITSFGDTKQESINQFEYGDKCCELTVNNSQNPQKPNKNESLSKLNISLNLDAINNIINKYDTSKAVEHNENSISGENEKVVYQKLNGNNLKINVEKSNILFQNGGQSINDSAIETLNESEIIINGSCEFDKLNILNMNNSKLIINGDLKIKNEFSINKQNTSSKNNLILINGNFIIDGNGPQINLKDSIVIVAGNFSVNNELKLEMQNSAIICIKNNQKENEGYETGNFDFGTNPTITNYNGSYLYCYGNFKVKNVMNINNYGENNLESSFVNQVINEFLTISNN